MYLDGGRRYPPTSSITSSNLVLEVTLCMSLSLRYSSVVLGNADQAKTLADKVHFLLLLHASAVHRYMYTVLYHLDHQSFSTPRCLWSVNVACIRSSLALPSSIYSSSSRSDALWCTGYHKRRTWPSSLISRQLVLWQSQIA